MSQFVRLGVAIATSVDPHLFLQGEEQARVSQKHIAIRLPRIGLLKPLSVARAIRAMS